MADTPYDRARTLSVARRAAEAGATPAAAVFRTEFEVSTKRDALDAVTQADVDAQRAAIELLEAECDDPVVVAEEEDARHEVPDDGPAWIVDPIDGTNNFARGNRLWATVVAHVVDGDPVASVTHLPAVGDTYAAGSEMTTRGEDPVSVSDVDDPGTMITGTIFGLGAERRPIHATVADAIVREFGDLRRTGSGQVTLAMVAAGELDAAISAVPQSPWDTVAGAHLIEAAGGTVTDLDGDPWRHDSDSMIATNGRAHDAVLDLVNDALDGV